MWSSSQRNNALMYFATMGNTTDCWKAVPRLAENTCCPLADWGTQSLELNASSARGQPWELQAVLGGWRWYSIQHITLKKKSNALWGGRYAIKNPSVLKFINWKSVHAFHWKAKPSWVLCKRLPFLKVGWESLEVLVQGKNLGAV